MREKTLVLIKPDGVQRGLIGQIISRIEEKGLKISALKLLRFDEELASKFYQEHRQKPFFAKLKDFIISGPSVAMVIEGDNCISIIRTMMGATDPAKAAPGTIRAKMATDITHNVIHGTDSPEKAAREINLIFNDQEILNSK